MTCPFCTDDIKNSVFASSENFMAIYNIAPIFPGHSLIIPKVHLKSALDLSEENLSEMMSLTRRVTIQLMVVFNAKAFNWSVQDHEIAGQTLSHMHLHIVLRYEGDLPDPGDWYPILENNYNDILDSASRKRLSKMELEKIVNKLKSTFAN